MAWGSSANRRIPECLIVTWIIFHYHYSGIWISSFTWCYFKYTLCIVYFPAYQKQSPSTGTLSNIYTESNSAGVWSKTINTSNWPSLLSATGFRFLDVYISLMFRVSLSPFLQTPWLMKIPLIVPSNENSIYFICRSSHELKLFSVRLFKQWHSWSPFTKFFYPRIFSSLNIGSIFNVLSRATTEIVI